MGGSFNAKLENEQPIVNEFYVNKENFLSFIFLSLLFRYLMQTNILLMAFDWNNNSTNEQNKIK